MALLEICCYSVECASAAIRAGADRIELCCGRQDGGLTPSWGMLNEAAQRCHLPQSDSRTVGFTVPVHPIIRPRGGDFCYSNSELTIMLRDIASVRELGFPGLVTGVLASNGSLDLARMRQIMQAAEGMSVTFHRAFDLCRDPWQMLAQLTDLGVARILTSGQRQTAEQGLALISALTARSTGPLIMAGAGVRVANLSRFIAAGIREVHSSAGRCLPSPLCDGGLPVSMSGVSQADEYSRYQVDTRAVAAMKRQLQQAGLH